MGHKPETINYRFSYHSLISAFFANPSYFIKKSIAEFITRKETSKKTEIFKKSIKKYLSETSKEYKSIKELRECEDKYDVYLTGSDQVWNPMIFPDNLSVRLLEFASSDKTIASYAASISAKTITPKEVESIRHSLERFDYISVREASTKKIIGNIPGKEVHINVDPCLLLKEDQWKKIAELPKETNYLLVYKLMSQPGMNEFVKRISEENGLKVISIGKLNGYEGEYTCVPYTSPERFLGYFSSASYIITNSFHGVVFSIINKKRATFFLPYASFDRALDLIKKTGTELLLEQRYLSDEELEQAYTNVDAVIEKERNNSKKYLLGVFSEE